MVQVGGTIWLAQMSPVIAARQTQMVLLGSQHTQQRVAHPLLALVHSCGGGCVNVLCIPAYSGGSIDGGLPMKQTHGKSLLRHT